MMSYPLRERLFIGFQKLVPRRALTRLIYRLTRIEKPWLKNLSIRAFVRAFSVDISDAENAVPDDFKSFNDFFSRSLKAGARTIDPAADAFVSPCDGTLSQFGPIVDNQIIQAKGVNYSMAELVNDPQVAKKFVGGRFATIYLAPYNYHRVHMPFDGSLVHEAPAGGDLYSVNQTTARRVPNLFTVNERRVMVFESEAGPFALIMVGAMNVGSITTSWAGETRAGFGEVEPAPGLRDGPTLRKGELVGWFNMGSTVILLTPENIDWLPQLKTDAIVRMGESLGRNFL